MRAKTSRPLFLALACLGFASGSALAQSPKAGASANGYPNQVLPVLAKHCVSCHGPNKPKAGLNLASYTTEAEALKDLKVWSKVLENVETGAMPPEEKPKLSDAESVAFIQTVQSLVSKGSCKTAQDPGRVTLRRLNREEYNNTIRDLVGVDFRPADDFPSDDVGYGFDNIGDVLTLPPLLMEKYLAAAESIADMAIISPVTSPEGQPAGSRPRPWPSQGRGGVSGESGFWLMSTNAEVGVDNAFPKSGILHPESPGLRPAGGEGPAKARVPDRRQAGEELRRQGRGGRRPRFMSRRSRSPRPTGSPPRSPTTPGIPTTPIPPSATGTWPIDWIEVVGPLFSLPNDLPDSHRKIIFRRPTHLNRREVAREVLQKFATRAFRRPATTGELDRLVNLVDLALKNGDGFEKGIQLAMQAVLVSPHFLFRVELETRPGAPRTLNDLELASRLSYFLWSSMPDDELLDLAIKGQLRTGKNLDAQVARMLKDPKSKEFVENFAGQWLQTRNLKLASPDRGRFNTFDEPLRQAMAKEVELFFAAIVHDDRPIADFLHADYTFVNERLARHYGIKDVTGDQFRRVTLTDKTRGGVDDDGLDLDRHLEPDADLAGQARQVDPGGDSSARRPLRHRPTSPTCLTTRRMSPAERFSSPAGEAPGRPQLRLVPLENGPARLRRSRTYDAIGAWREQDGKFPVDASGVLAQRPEVRRARSNSRPCL